MAHMVISQLAQASVNNVPLSFADHGQIFIHGPAFSRLPNASITVSSPSCGKSGSYMDPKYTGEGAGIFPEMEWEPSGLDQLMQYLLVVEDPDAPKPEPVVHGIYYNIPKREQRVINKDLRPAENSMYKNLLVGGFRYGKNSRNTIYLPPSPPPGTGPHKYFYQVVGLNEELDLDALSDIPSKEELALAVDGKVVGWGAWIGVCGGE